MSDDKLQKSESAIEVASNIGEAIERAVEKNNDVAQTGKSAVTVWPGMSDVCKCGHTYSQHNYSDSLTSETDPLGFCYECRGAGFTPDGSVRTVQAMCDCKQFIFADVPGNVRDLNPFFTDATTCIGGVSPDNTHECPGVRIDDDGRPFLCKCSCENCLIAESKKVGTNGMKPGLAGTTKVRDGVVTIETDDRTCIAFGLNTPGSNHMQCPVVVTSGGVPNIPTVCMCDCKDCKRAWFSDGRPIVREGKIIRTTPESVNPVKVADADISRWKDVGVLREKNDPADMVIQPGTDGRKFMEFAKRVGSPPTSILAGPIAKEEADPVESAIKASNAFVQSQVASEMAVDLLEVARGLRKCTHPMHDLDPRYKGQACGKVYLVSTPCSPECPCCAGIEGIKEWAPPLRPEGLKPVAPLSEQSKGRLWRGGDIPQPAVVGETLPPVPPATDPAEWARALAVNDKPAEVGRVQPGEMTARVNSVKVIKDKNGKPQLAMEMTIVQTGEVIRSTIPAGSTDENAEFLREMIGGLAVSGTEVPVPVPGSPLASDRDIEEGRAILAEVAKRDEENLPVVIPPPPRETCMARTDYNQWLSVRCELPPGHEGPHQTSALLDDGESFKWS